MAKERKVKDMTKQKIPLIYPEGEELPTTEITPENTEGKEAPANETGAPDIPMISLEAKEKNLDEEITSAIKEELAAESIYATAKQRVKEARKAYQEFLAQYRSEVSLPLLQEMIKR